MAQGLPATAATLLLAVAALAPARALPVMLGELQVTSTLGQPLDARIALEAAGGERLQSSCFFVLPDAALREARIAMTLERSARGAALRLRSGEAVQLPAASLRIAVACPDAEPGPRRDYALLIDPPTVTRTGDSAGAIGASLEARGDSLAAIARMVFPQDAAARRRYLDALVAANPGLSLDSTPPPGKRVALPDLRTFAGEASRPRTPNALTAGSAVHVARAAPSAAASSSRSEPGPASPTIAPAPREPAPRPAPAARAPDRGSSSPQAASTEPGRGASFVLKLSGAEVDLSRSRGMDERRRAQLRERLLLLEQDDQVSALLAMRHNLRQLESRLSELQLQLAAMPAAAPAPGAPPVKAPAPATPPVPNAAPPVPAAAAPAPSVPAPTSVPAAAAPAAEPKPAPARPTAEAKTAPPAAPNPSTPPKRGTVTPKPAGAPGDAWSLVREHAPWALLALLVLLLAAVALRRARRARPDESELEEAQPAEVSPAAPDATAEGIGEIAPPVATPVAHEGARAVVSSDSQLATRLAEADSGELRRRYIEQRFPEVATGAVVLEDTDSVIKGARLFYEDGQIPRAVELLELALEARPEETRLWLALFEIHRLERLAGPFADLATRFRASHGDSEEWQKVQQVGREIDPANALYSPVPIDGLGTIGPSEARRLAAANAPFDPIAENWLNAPMDFENEALARELRSALMEAAGITEADLAPNPAPALRNVEMFTVA